MGLVVVLAAFGVIAAPAAEAQSTFDDARVSFGGVDGQSRTVRAVGDQLWVGGEFTTAFDTDHTTSHARANVAVFDFNTGDVHPFVVNTNDKVKAIETDEVSRVWVAGNFTEIRGQQVTYIAAINLFTGEIDYDFSVVVDYPINALHYNDGWLYIGGEFGQVNGLYYNKMARVDAQTGAVDTSFRANPNALVRSIDTFADRVYAAGFFETVGKPPDQYPRRWVAGFDVETGQPAGPDFVLQALQPGEGIHKAGVWDVHVSPDGSYLYTGDQRNFITKWNRLTGAKLWSREAEGDIQTIQSDATSVYLGTHDGFLSKGDQRLLFALQPANGSTDNSWVPLMNSFIGTLDIEMSQGALIAVGDFTEVNGESSPHVVVFHSPAWTGAEPIVVPPTPGDVGCDASWSIVDALMIAQWGAGLRTEVASCESIDRATEIHTANADVNNDGSVDIGDALLIAQCTVGINNVFCP